jgi:hypothetical protein
MKKPSLSVMTNAILFIAITSINTWTVAQNSTTTTCLPANVLKAPHLYGTWNVDMPISVDAGAATKNVAGTVVFEKNAEHPDSISGWLTWNGSTVFVAGDIDEGNFSLEESDDGKRISAVWDGTIAPGSCGKAITGSRRSGDVLVPFTLRKPAGWS